MNISGAKAYTDEQIKKLERKICNCDDFKVVSELPITGKEGVVYYVTGDGYYYWDGSVFVSFGKSIDPDLYGFERSQENAGIFELVEYYSEGILRKTSSLSGGTPPEYTTQTIVLYEADGVTVTSTTVFTLAYSSGILISKTLI